MISYAEKLLFLMEEPPRQQGTWVPRAVKRPFPAEDDRVLFPRWYLTRTEQREDAAPPDLRERFGEQKLDTNED